MNPNVALNPFVAGSSALDRTQVNIDLGDRSYPIVIGRGLLNDAQTWQGLPQAHLALIVTNTVVVDLYAQKLRQALGAHYDHVEVCVLPDGESHKDWQTLQMIFDHLVDHGADRRTVVFALGGGVVGDMTGFASACYMRGVPFVQIPTTLLSQVDSSVGGKTAINHPRAKNMVGAFYQPLRVVCDLNTLDTLPEREFSAGVAEIIKYGPIADPAFFEWLESNMDALMQRDTGTLLTAVRRSCEIKAWVVACDERESGLREILNLGHTFGHAIEAGMGYGKWLHGEAVAAGMVMAADLSVRLEGLATAYRDRLVRLLERARLPVQGPLLHDQAEQSAEHYLRWMRSDKKALAGDIRFVLLSDWGRALTRKAPESMVRATLDACCA